MGLWEFLRKGTREMFTAKEKQLLESLLKKEMAKVNELVWIDEEQQRSSKEIIKDVAKKINEASKPRQLVSKDDILALDDSITFDEIIFVLAGKPIARIKRPS
jgi:phosphopentomutase